MTAGTGTASSAGRISTGYLTNPGYQGGPFRRALSWPFDWFTGRSKRPCSRTPGPHAGGCGYQRGKTLDHVTPPWQAAGKQR